MAEKREGERDAEFIMLIYSLLLTRKPVKQAIFVITPMSMHSQWTQPKHQPLKTGSPDPRAYSRNKRGIAGSLVWINFDRHALLSLFYKARGLFVADQDEIRPQFQNPFTEDTTALFNSSVVRDAGPAISSTIDPAG